MHLVHLDESLFTINGHKICLHFIPSLYATMIRLISCNLPKLYIPNLKDKRYIYFIIIIIKQRGKKKKYKYLDKQFFDQIHQ